DGASVGPVTTYAFSNVIANHTIAASFALDSKMITASASTGGSISPSGAVSVNCGTNKTFTVSANHCYHIADVLVDGASVGVATSYTFNNVTANHTIATSLALDGETITASAGTGGAISPSGAVAVNRGSDQTCTTTT